ncbi:MAG: cytochrome d ubiquinol oxidase subunit II [Actinomycetaceae bacterium]|nr:cytochrome d ubiquinol oxidase subunit II [Actinomycetaceae bacterium]
MDLTAIQLIWFILIAVLWIGYLTLEGFGFGVGMLLKILPKTEKERRVALNTIGPHWDGNEVWVLTAGGATFAAFPEWYATMFSGMYLALVLVLVCLILRVCAIEWRKQINSDAWRRGWDIAHTGSCWVVSVLWGVAFANLVQGMPIEVGRYESGEFTAVDPAVAADSLADNHHFLTGSFFSLLTPFTLLGGVVTTLLFLSHGALYLSIKTEGELRKRAESFASTIILPTTAVTAIWALWAQFAHSNNGVSIVPLLACAACLVATILLAKRGNTIRAFIAHFTAIAMAVVFIWFTIFPDALKSSIDSRYSLTLAQAAATAPTQTIMTIAAVVFVPVVLGYTIWAYRVFARRLSVDQIPDEPVGLDMRKIREFETTK